MSAALDDLDDRPRPGICRCCELAAPVGKAFCRECSLWSDAGNAIKRAATALRATTAPPWAERGGTWRKLKTV